jgi:hypothetical protein
MFLFRTSFDTGERGDTIVDDDPDLVFAGVRVA